MSEKILKALMELFAIIARPENNETAGLDRRPVVESFLRRQLNEELVSNYIKIFDFYFEKHQSLVNRRGIKRIGPDSVKLLRICDEINHELTQQQKIIVLISMTLQHSLMVSSEKQCTKYEFSIATHEIVQKHLCKD